MKLEFGTKAETLGKLRGCIKSAVVLRSTVFTVRDWLQSPQEILQRIQVNYRDSKVIIRSSVLTEDGEKYSRAGEFVSVGGVNADDKIAVQKGILAVLDSYPDDNQEEQFFVQRYLERVSLSGVVFTRELMTQAPYYVVNYDKLSGRSDTVTSGSSSELQTYVRYRKAKDKYYSAEMEMLLKAVKEIETLFGSDLLDIEFAVGEDGKVYILQVRPLTIGPLISDVHEKEFPNYLLRIQSKIRNLRGGHPGLLGSRTVYSNMLDWNPAEIIGLKPRNLALSLYKVLVTDSIWAEQRYNYGYRDLRGHPLLVSLLGVPYIDVRVSFNSFVPKELDDGLSAKLVDYYLERLIERPSNHDKAEFEIIFSCYYFNVVERLESLKNHGFSNLEIDRLKFSLLTLTNRMISPEAGICRQDLNTLSRLEKRFSDLSSSSLPLIEKIYWLIGDAQRYGTLPFAGLARAAFVSVQFLNSLCEIGIMSKSEQRAFMTSLNTVTRRMSTIYQGVVNGEVRVKDFLGEFGHLRPGTYDILSPRYDESFETYFGQGVRGGNRDDDGVSFVLSTQQQKEVSNVLVSNGLWCSCEQLFKFIRESIEGREYAKFLFTRNLSDALQLIRQFGAEFGFSEDELSHLDVRVVLSLFTDLTSGDVISILRESIERNKEEYAVTSLIKLPDLLTDDFSSSHFYLSEAEPTYITHKRVTKCIVSEKELDDAVLNDKIVLIPSADPGFDWLFTRKIAGLVTMFGGANSHMAIRCAELSVPGVIGCGERCFYEWSNAKVLELDCGTKQVNIIGGSSM